MTDKTYTLADFDLKPGDWVKFNVKRHLRNETEWYEVPSGGFSGGGDFFQVLKVLRPSMVLRDELDSIAAEIKRKTPAVQSVNVIFYEVGPKEKESAKDIAYDQITRPSYFLKEKEKKESFYERYDIGINASITTSFKFMCEYMEASEKRIEALEKKLEEIPKSMNSEEFNKLMKYLKGDK